MSRHLGLLLVICCLMGAAAVLPVAAGEPSDPPPPDASGPVVGYPVNADLSPALSDLPALPPSQTPTLREMPRLSLPAVDAGGLDPLQAAEPDGALQPTSPGLLMPSPLTSFEGVSNVNGVLPPDTNGDIGYDAASGRKYYMQWVNLSYAIWDVTTTPTVVISPTNGSQLWSGFGGACQTSNDGDPIVLFDSLASRWLVSQFALPNFPSGPYYQCIAVSQTANPTGAWYRYAYLVSSTKMNDYPHFGVWPDGYYMTVNQFTNGSAWGGAGVFVFHRAKMLAGDPTAAFQYFDLYGASYYFGGQLPADLDGLTPPPAGAPNYIAQVDDSTRLGDPGDRLRIWEFHVDWDNPANTTLGLNGQPNYVLPVVNFVPLCSGTRSCVPQPGTSQRLDAIGDRLMHRLAYRNFGTHAALVVNHTVDAGAGQAAPRWYEVRIPAGGSPGVYQQGTYAPDSEHRWMGSAAMDHQGNLALGYSVSSASVYPSIRYTGRLASDSLNTLPQTETSLIAGSGSQTHTSARWGDYSMMGIDPVDDCTFWYTQEYYTTTSSAGWRTRIGSFKFPTCAIGPTGSLSGTVSNAVSLAPVAQATVLVSTGSLPAGQTTTDAQGRYLFGLPVGTYTVTASAYGLQPQTATGVSVISGTTTLRDFALTPLPSYVLSGTVIDARSLWPLYARIDVSAPGFGGASLWTDPVTGFYSLTLAGGISHTLNTTAWVPGYQPAVTHMPPLAADQYRVISLTAQTSCLAPGYQGVAHGVYQQDFEINAGGYLTTGSSLNTSWAWGQPSASPGPGSAHSGARVWATNLTGSYGNGETSILTSPIIDLSAHAGSELQLSWWQWLQTESGYDPARVDVSSNGGSSWSTVYGPVSGSIDLAWARRVVTLTSAYATSGFRLRFVLTTDSSIVYPGWYVDDIDLSTWQCVPPTGGLVVGQVSDGNTGLPLAGAAVADDAGHSATTSSTPDPAVGDAFYTLYVLSGTHTLTATLPGGYGPAAALVAMPAGGTLRQDLSLPAGRLLLQPTWLSQTLVLGAGASTSLSISNTGLLGAAYEWVEVPGRSEAVLIGPYQPAAYVVKPFRQSQADTRGLPLEAPPAAPPYAAGDVLQSWSVAEFSWGVAYDSGGSVWVSSPGSAWYGANRITEYAPAGAPTGRQHAYTWNPASGPADAAFNWNTRTLWVMNTNTGVSNCIYEIDPASGFTGRTICPTGPAGFAVSQRGLAYDPVTDTYFAGSWNDSSIHRFAPDGTLLSSVSVGLAVAGLAYNPDTHHLFVMVNSDPNLVYVLDIAANYALLGQFAIPGFDAYSGAGLEIDCAGRLWALNQNNKTVYQVESGETSTLCSSDVPWLSTAPVSGTLTSSALQPITVTFDSRPVQQPGMYLAALRLREDTPYLLPEIPVTMTVLAPANWGQAHGRVYSLGYCDSYPALAAGAQIVLTTSTGITHTLQQGKLPWSWWAVEGPLTVTAALAGHASQTQRIQVPAGQGVNVDLNLRLQHNCGSAWPNPVELTLPPGVTVTLPIRLRNSGALPWSWQLSESSMWLALTGSISGTTPADDSQVSQVTITSAGMLPGAAHTALVEVWHDDSLLANPLSVQVRLTVGGSIILPFAYGVTSAPAADTAARLPGETVLYSLQVTNTSEYTDTFLVEVQSGWPASAPAQVGPLAGGAGESVQVSVTVPLTAAAASYSRTDVRFVSQGDPSRSALSTLVTVAAVSAVDRFGVDALAVSGAQTGLPGAELAFAVLITNTGSVTDSFDLALVHSAWPANFPGQVGPLAAGASTVMSVAVSVPLTAAGASQAQTQVRFTSHGDPAESASVTLVSTAANRFGLAAAAVTGAQMGPPGSALVYAVLVTNTGNVTDSFSLTVSGGAGWAIAPTPAGPLASGQSAIVLVRVNIPAGTAAGTTEETTVSVTSQGDPGQTAQVVLSTTAAAYRLVLPLLQRHANDP